MPEVNDLHSELKNLIEAFPIRWTYAILWRCSSPPSVLSFHDGYHRATGKTKTKQLRILGLSVTVSEDVTDAEWFFKISAAQSFGVNEDLPGHALCGEAPVWVTAADEGASRWERAKWGQQFGIRTLLCVPLKERGVVELASTEIVPYDVKTIEEIAVFVDRIQTPRAPIMPLPLFMKQFRNDKRLHERTDNEMQNRSNDSIYKQYRGKEKINDSKCSWPLLTESSDRGTDRTFSYSHDYSGPS